MTGVSLCRGNHDKWSLNCTKVGQPKYVTLELLKRIFFNIHSFFVSVKVNKSRYWHSKSSLPFL